jgi:quaternary ammonium compound-resistance protein SugE
MPHYIEDGLDVFFHSRGRPCIAARSRVMNWLILLIAGLLEMVWAVGLKYTDGFTKLFPTLFTLGAMSLSVYLLSIALRTLPLGTGYPVWVGVGAVGTALAGVILFQETLTPLKLLSIALVIAGIAGLKLASAG